MQKTLTLAISLLLLLIACTSAENIPLPISPVPSAASALGEVRSVAEEFGLQFKNVSLLAQDAPDQIEAYYAPYITEDLLADWQADPAQAPGRLTSSPWSDRIEIETIEQVDSEEYIVLGLIVEVTSDNQTANSVPIEFTIIKIDSAWLISAFEFN